MAALCQHVQQEHEPSHSGIQSKTFGNIEEVHIADIVCLQWMLHVQSCMPSFLWPRRRLCINAALSQGPFNIKRTIRISTFCKVVTIGATTVGTGVTGPPKLGDQQCIGPPQLLGRSFQKARNFTASSHQNAEFSMWVFTNFPGVIPPDPHSGMGRPPPTPNTQLGLWPNAGCRGPKSWSPSTFQPGLHRWTWPRKISMLHETL